MNRVYAGLMGAICCASVAMYFLAPEPSLAEFALAIACLVLGVPLLAYASGGKALLTRFPRSLIATTRGYFALGWLCILVYAAYRAIQSGSLGVGLYFGVFGFLWVTLAFGVIVIPGWLCVHFGGLAYRKLQGRAELHRESDR